MLGDVRGQCPDTVPEWHKRNLVTLSLIHFSSANPILIHPLPHTSSPSQLQI